MLNMLQDKKEKKVRKKAFGFISILLVSSLLLVACSSTPTATEYPTTPDLPLNTSTPLVAQPTNTPIFTTSIPEDELDAAFQSMLDNMVSYNTIGLEALMERLGEEPPPFLLDVRSLSEVEQTGRIESSIVIPLRDLANTESIALLPDFDTNIITYCGSGWRCTIAMTFLEALGWNNVLTLGENGLAGWLNAGYPVVTDPASSEALNVAQPDPAIQAWLDELLDKLPDGFGSVTPELVLRAIADLPDLILIDVRRAEEIIEDGGIKNAIHIPLESFIQLKEKWPQSKEAKILVYSDDGYRSTIAMTLLWSYGYVGVASLQGGLDAWVNAGFPVTQIAVGE
jgi:rhodanese-related sulfurtransferase